MPADIGVGVGPAGDDPPPQAPNWVARARASTVAKSGAVLFEAPGRSEWQVFATEDESYCPAPIVAIPGVGVGEGGTGQFRPNPPVAVKSAVWHNKYPGRRRAKSTSRATSHHECRRSCRAPTGPPAPMARSSSPADRSPAPATRVRRWPPARGGARALGDGGDVGLAQDWHLHHASGQHVGGQAVAERHVGAGERVICVPWDHHRGPAVAESVQHRSCSRRNSPRSRRVPPCSSGRQGTAPPAAGPAAVRPP